MTTQPPRRSVWHYMSIARTPFPTRALLAVTVLLLILLVISAITESNGPRNLPSPHRSVAPSPMGNGQFVFYPTSARVQQGVAYRFGVMTHCGLGFPLLVDFDGSFWYPAAGTQIGNGTAPPGYGQPNDQGTIILDSATQAEYHSQNGPVLILKRHSGPVTASPCS